MTCIGCNANLDAAESLPVVWWYGKPAIKCPICGVYQELPLQTFNPSTTYLVTEE